MLWGSGFVSSNTNNIWGYSVWPSSTRVRRRKRVDQTLVGSNGLDFVGIATLHAMIVFTIMSIYIIAIRFHLPVCYPLEENSSPKKTQVLITFSVTTQWIIQHISLKSSYYYDCGLLTNISRENASKII